MKRFWVGFLCTAMVISLFECFAFASETETYSNYDIITEVALAFDRKGAKIPYDQVNARRSIYSSPEDATSQRTIFLDCSAYVNSCYREAFGVNVMPYEIGVTGTSPSTANYETYLKNNTDAEDVVGFWEPANYTTDAQRKEVVNFIYENLEIGDVLAYRHGTSTSTKGHVYMYLGDSTFIHCAGAGSYVRNSTYPWLSYDSGPSEITSNGTIETITAYNIFENKTHNRYIFKATESDTVKNFGIIRPMARNLTPTEESLNRMKIAGLSMEKTSSIHENASVNTGETLTYTVTLENTNSTAINGVEITDTLPEGTSFVSGDTGVVANGNSVSWQGDVPGKSTIKVNYSVKILKDEPGSLIVSNETYVSGVKLGCITHSVSGLTKTQHALIGEWAIKYAKESKAFDDTFEMIKTLYQRVGDVSISDYNSVEALLDDLIDTPNRTRYFTTEPSKIIAPNLYGGYDIRYGWLYLESENDKTRLPKKEHLSIGDIILADWSEGNGGNRAYIYAGNKTLVTVDNGICITKEIGDDIYTVNKNIIISLLGYNRYAVLRPAMSDLGFELDVSSIKITTPPQKTEYNSGENFDDDGMVVSAILTDGSKMTLSNYDISPKILSYPEDSVTVTFGDKSAEVKVTVKDTYTSITEASKLSEGQRVSVKGLVAGVAHEGQNNDTEMIIKDINSDTLMGVRNIPYGTYPNYGYKKGDLIVFDAVVKKDTSTSTCYDLKKYLEFVNGGNNIEDTIISRNNDMGYKFDTAIDIDSWDDMYELFTSSLAPYTYLKINTDSYMTYYAGTFDDYYRFHNNSTATALSEIKPASAKAITFMDGVMKANLGSDWLELLEASQDTTYPGAEIKKEFYVIYFGGNKTYHQLAILDESWIYDPEFYIQDISEDKKSINVNIPKTGDYKVIFADYDSNNKLNDFDMVDAKVLENQKGIVNVKLNKNITLGQGDRVMLWNNMDDMISKCDVFVIE